MDAAARHDEGVQTGLTTDEPQVLWRALAVARGVVLVYAVVVNAVHVDSYARPALAWVVVAALAAWTAGAPWIYAQPQRRPAAIGAEIALATSALLLTPWIQGDITADLPSVPTFWIAAPVIAAAVQWEWRGGLFCALGEAAVDVATGGDPTGSGSANIFLMIVIGLIVGYAAELVRIGTEDRARAAAIAAASLERERLARAVHDGVLQALAYVQRRGTEIGGEAAELAELAGQHEVALRGLVSASPLNPAVGVSDLAALLHGQASPRVSVATPGEPVLVASALATELTAAVQAALDNTVRHAGGAAAYVLLEIDEDHLMISVGDDGPGIAPGRLEAASASGRMGVARSITSRLTDLGGTAVLTTAPGRGTEWELRVPRGRR